MPNNRRPIVIADDRITTGTRVAHRRNDDPKALLQQYLRLIRRVRNQRQGRHIALRRADIEVLANHLGWTDDQVLARLADMMGATSRQRRAMLGVLATGAALITITSPVAAADGTIDDELPIIVVQDDALSGPTTARPVSRPVVAPSTATGHHRSVVQLDGAPGIGGESLADAPELIVPDVVDEPPIADAPSSAPAIDDDGNTVAVGLPPTPPPTDAPAPEPAAVELQDAPSPTGVDADGNTVAVGEPPVPPATSAAGVDDDGNVVAVGLPPVPPPPP